MHDYSLPQTASLHLLFIVACLQAAIEWCLIVQEAAMYLPYPAEVLRQKGFSEEWDARGRLVFRGPR